MFENQKERSGVVENVAIIGAGIGGLATAIALLAKGIKVQVYEARSLRPVAAAAGLTLLPNGAGRPINWC